MVSVIVPVYNIELYLDRCVKSLIDQSQDIEIILVDDGSTDRSVQICDKYAENNSNVKVIHIQNSGVSNARNIGLSLAKGEYITFVDGDDWISEDFLQIAINKLKLTGSDIFMGSYTENYDDGTEIKVNENIPTMILNYEECIEAVFIKLPNKADLSFAVWGKVFRASLWKNVRFDTNLSMGEDAVAFWDVLKHANKVLYMPVMGYHYMQRVDSAVHTTSLKKALDNLKMHQYFYVESKANFNKYVQKYFLQRYYAEEITVIIKAVSQKVKNPQVECIKRKVYGNIRKYLQSSWNLYGMRGVAKVCVASMPSFFIRVILNTHNVVRGLCSMLL